jgi:hypothetical protein
VAVDLAEELVAAVGEGEEEEATVAEQRLTPRRRSSRRRRRLECRPRQTHLCTLLEGGRAFIFLLPSPSALMLCFMWRPVVSGDCRVPVRVPYLAC